jgi:ABC-2 type transport system ATP-binding protein
MAPPEVGFLKLDALTRRFGDRVAVDNLTVDIARGEVFGFLGPNGAGKSTTFHLLTGLLAPDGGRVLIEGAEAPPTDGRVRRRLGVVFQEPSLDDKLTARENLRLGAALYGLGGKRADARIDELLALVELGERAREPVERFSGGMKRRLEIARVLLHEPEILVMDEPSRGIDAPTLRRIWEQLLELRRARRMTILLTTHMPEEAEYCDRIAVLDKGRVIACDTPEALRQTVGGDVIVLDGESPEPLCDDMRARFGLDARVVDGSVVLEAPRGHELIPRLVEQLPPGRLRAVSMRRPTLADVFVHLTGRGLN